MYEKLWENTIVIPSTIRRDVSCLHANIWDFKHCTWAQKFVKDDVKYLCTHTMYEMHKWNAFVECVYRFLWRTCIAQRVQHSSFMACKAFVKFLFWYLARTTKVTKNKTYIVCSIWAKKTLKMPTSFRKRNSNTRGYLLKNLLPTIACQCRLRIHGWLKEANNGHWKVLRKPSAAN